MSNRDHTHYALLREEMNASLASAINQAGGNGKHLMRDIRHGLSAAALIEILAPNGIRFVFDPEAHELRDDPRFMASHAHRVRKRVVKQSRESTKQGRRLLF